MNKIKLKKIEPIEYWYDERYSPDHSWHEATLEAKIDILMDVFNELIVEVNRLSNEKQ